MAKKYLAPLPYDTASGKYYEKLMELSHDPVPAPAPATVTTTTLTLTDTAIKKMPPMMSMGGFNLVMAQSLWDATMAFSVFEFLKKNKGKKVMHVNGRFHSDEGFAIVEQIKKYNSKIRSIIVSSGTDKTFPNIDWNQHKHLGDYVIMIDPTMPKTYEE